MEQSKKEELRKEWMQFFREHALTKFPTIQNEKDVEYWGERFFDFFFKIIESQEEQLEFEIRVANAQVEISKEKDVIINEMYKENASLKEEIAIRANQNAELCEQIELALGAAKKFDEDNTRLKQQISNLIELK